MQNKDDPPLHSEQKKVGYRTRERELQAREAREVAEEKRREHLNAARAKLRLARKAAAGTWLGMHLEQHRVAVAPKTAHKHLPTPEERAAAKEKRRQQAAIRKEMQDQVVQGTRKFLGMQDIDDRLAQQSERERLNDIHDRLWHLMHTAPKRGAWRLNNPHAKDSQTMHAFQLRTWQAMEAAHKNQTHGSNNHKQALAEQHERETNLVEAAYAYADKTVAQAAMTRLRRWHAKDKAQTKDVT